MRWCQVRRDSLACCLLSANNLPSNLAARMGAAEGWQPEQEAPAKQAKLAVPALQPAAPARSAARFSAADWQGFAAWHRAQRASSDTFGFCLSLVSLPAGDVASSGPACRHAAACAE